MARINFFREYFGPITANQTPILGSHVNELHEVRRSVINAKVCYFSG